MNALQPLPWQQELWLEVTALVLQGRLPHALLLSGPVGVGKRPFARALAAFVLCESRSGYACGRCRSCAQLAVGNHPNALLLSNEGLHGLASTDSGRHDQGLAHWLPDKDSKKRDIAIAAGRKMIEMITLSSHYQGAKIVVIDPADALNESSVNALLKTIEEPPPGTHLLLLSERPQALKPTLRSRCQRLRFAPPPRETALAWLQAEHPGAEALLDLAHGAPLRALALAGSDTPAQHRDWSELVTAVLALKQEPIGAAQRIGKDDAGAFFPWLTGWLTAQLRSAVGGRGAVLPPTELSALLQESVDSRRRLEANNGNAQMLLEALMVLASRKARAQRRAA